MTREFTKNLILTLLVIAVIVFVISPLVLALEALKAMFYFVLTGFALIIMAMVLLFFNYL